MKMAAAIVGKEEMLKIDECVRKKKVPEPFHELGRANARLAGYVQELYGRFPEHQVERDKFKDSDKEVEKKTKPQAVVIGADGCRPDFMADLLARHPKLAVPPGHVHHFSHLYRGLGASVVGGAAIRGYHEMLTGDNLKKNASLVLEVSPSYMDTHWFPNLPKQLASFAPDVKLLAVVCDPAHRILMQYETDLALAHKNDSCADISDPLTPIWTEKARALEFALIEDGVGNFEELADAIYDFSTKQLYRVPLARRCSSNSCHYHKYYLTGLYQQHLMRVLHWFPPHHIMVVDLAGLISMDPWPIVSKVLSFLGLDPGLYPQDTLQMLEQHQDIAPSVQRGLDLLHQLYINDNELLACTLRQEFPLHWQGQDAYVEPLAEVCARLAQEGKLARASQP